MEVDLCNNQLLERRPIEAVRSSGGEGGVKPHLSLDPHFTRKNAAISFIAGRFRNLRVKPRKVERSTSKPKKWPKTVARSSPGGKFTFLDCGG